MLRVEVAPPRADDIVIEPMSEPLHVGDEIRLEATPKDKRGWPVYRPVTWHSADPGVAVVTPHGTIAGLAAGTVRITAALDDARASMVIPVLPPRVVGGGHRGPADVRGGGPDVRPHRDAGRSCEQPAAASARGLDDQRRERRAGDVGRLGGRAPAGRGRADGHLRGRPGLGADRRGAPSRHRCRSSPRSVPPLAGGPGAGGGAAVLAGLAVVAAGLVWLSVRPGTVTDTPSGGRRAAGYAAGGVGVDTATPARVAITSRPTRALRPDSALQLVAEVRDAGGRLDAGRRRRVVLG